MRIAPQVRALPTGSGAPATFDVVWPPPHAGAAQVRPYEPGRLLVTTPGSRRLVVDHVPFDVSVVVNLYANGDVTIAAEQAAVRYAYGHGRVTAAEREQVLTLVREAAAVVATGHGEQFGVVGGSEQLATWAAHVRELRRRLADTDTDIRRTEARRAEYDTQLRALHATREQLAAALAAAQASAPAGASPVDELDAYSRHLLAVAIWLCGALLNGGDTLTVAELAAVAERDRVPLLRPGDLPAAVAYAADHDMVVRCDDGTLVVTALGALAAADS